MHTKDQVPYPKLLIPSLTSFYDIEKDEFLLLLNGAPLGFGTNAQAFHERCAAITETIIALIRESYRQQKAQVLNSD